MSHGAVFDDDFEVIGKIGDGYMKGVSLSVEMLELVAAKLFQGIGERTTGSIFQACTPGEMGHRTAYSRNQAMIAG